MRSRTRPALAMTSLAAMVVTMLATAMPSAEAATCRTYTLIGVRGTNDGSQSSMGTTLPTAAAQFVARKGSSRVTTDYVSYPATTAYTSSMSAGRSALTSKLNSYSSACGSTKFVLFGYSQGAHVVGDVVVGLSSSMRAKVLAVGLLGDPMFNPGLSGSLTKDRNHGGMFGRRSSWPSGVRVYDICNTRDQVCASYSMAQSLAYLGNPLAPPREHQGYTGTTYSPVSGHSAAWAIGDWAGGL